MEEIYVNETYEQIADEFDLTRHSKWIEVEEFLKGINKDAYILDAGCGNGKNMIGLSNCIGCDTCINLLEKCKKKGLNVINADTRDLPFDNETFDAIISIAVIHHIADKYERINAIFELLRVLKKEGIAMIELWSTSAYNKKQFEKQKTHNDYLVSWNNKYKRYYHLFDEKEIDYIIEILDGHATIEKKQNKQNWILYVNKKN